MIDTFHFIVVVIGDISHSFLFCCYFLCQFVYVEHFTQGDDSKPKAASGAPSGGAKVVKVSLGTYFSLIDSLCGIYINVELFRHPNLLMGSDAAISLLSLVYRYIYIKKVTSFPINVEHSHG